MTVEIVQLNRSNTAVLDNLEDDIFDEKIVPHRLTALLSEQNQIMLVAILEGVVIGQVLAVIHRHPDKPTELYIDDLAVSKTLRRRRIATRLLEELFRIGMNKGCEVVWVAAEPDNEPAKKFYSSLNLSAKKSVLFEGSLPITA